MLLRVYQLNPQLLPSTVYNLYTQQKFPTHSLSLIDAKTCFRQQKILFFSREIITCRPEDGQNPLTRLASVDLEVDFVEVTACHTTYCQISNQLWPIEGEQKVEFFFLRFFQTRQANKIEFHKFLFHLCMPIIILYLCKYIRLRDEYILIQFHEFLLLL